MTTQTATYSSRAAARKGAKRQGIDLTTMVFSTNSADRWYWKPVGKMAKKKPVSSEASVASEKVEAKAKGVAKKLTAKNLLNILRGDELAITVKKVLPAKNAKTEQAKWDAETKELYGHVNCPHCKINLMNGVGQHGDNVNGTIIEHEEFDKCCLGCGGEFGKLIAKRASRQGANGEGVKIQKDRPTQNGVTRQSAGGKCDFVWVVCDNILEATGSGPTIKELRAMFVSKYPEHNVNNAAIELYRWRKFNGISSR